MSRRYRKSEKKIQQSDVAEEFLFRVCFYKTITDAEPFAETDVLKQRAAHLWRRWLAEMHPDYAVVVRRV